MPTFDTIPEAQKYMQTMLENNFLCEMRFNIEGKIDVFCKLAVNEGKKNIIKREVPHNQKTLFGEEEPEKKIKSQSVLAAPPPRFELQHELRDYQLNAVRFALAHRHVIIELPTGTGKTETAIGIADRIMSSYPQSRILVIVPTQILVLQWVRKGFERSGMPASSFYAEEKHWGYHTVTTYQSAVAHLEELNQYDIIIFDEVHHLFSPEYRKILFTVLDRPFLIGLTATVREYGEGKVLQNRYFPNIFTRTIEDFQTGNTRVPVKIELMPVVFSEEDMLLYNQYQETIIRATRSIGTIADWPRIAGSQNSPRASLARKAIRDNALQKRLLTEMPDKMGLILNIIQNVPGQFIVFTDTINSIQDIEQELAKMGITAGSIYSGVNPEKRKNIIQGLENKSIRVLVGGSAITEGLDLPDISNGILASMLVASSRTYVQRIGRLLRPVPGKQVKLYLIYVKDTKEEKNAKKIMEIMGEGDAQF